jgi:hypothetical protein
MLLAIVVALIFCSKALARDVTVSSCWAYGVVCLLLLFLTVIQVVYKVNTPLEGVLPAKKAITALLSDFSLRNIYALLVDSWMLIILHVGALICGVASIYLAIKHA